MTRWLIASIAVAAVACYVSPGGGTQGQGSSSSCAGNVPTTCPQTTPSYATDVSPLLFSYCTSCHQPNGSQSGKPLDTWANVSKLSSKVESKIADCSMPPSSSPQPTAAERDVILSWIACGAPNN